MTSSSSLPIMVSTEELKSFYSIDRTLFTRLVFNLNRDINESFQVVGFLLLLEQQSYARNLVANLNSTPDSYIEAVANETNVCLNLLRQDSSTFFDDDRSVIPLIKDLSGSKFTLRLIPENRETFLTSLRNNLNDYYRAFEDICVNVARYREGRLLAVQQVNPNWSSFQQVIPNWSNIQQVIPNMLSAQQVNPNMLSAQQEMVLNPNCSNVQQVIPNRLSAQQVNPNMLSAPQERILNPNWSNVQQVIPNRSSAQQVNPNMLSVQQERVMNPIWLSAQQQIQQVNPYGSSAQQERVLNPNYLSSQQQSPSRLSVQQVNPYRLSGQQERIPNPNWFSVQQEGVLALTPVEEETNRTATGTEEVVVAEDDRTVFLTFSKGYPVSEEEIRVCFTEKYGEVIETIRMKQGEVNNQPLFAMMVLKMQCVWTMKYIVGREKNNKFIINGKHVLARKYVSRNPR